MPTPIRNLLFGKKESDHEDDDDDKKDDAVPESVEANIASSPPAPAKSPTSTTTTPSKLSLQSAASWNVRIPPIKKHMVAGRMVPTARQAVAFLAQKRRHVRIERRGPVTSAPADEDVLQDDDIVVVRVFSRSKGTAFRRKTSSSGGDSSSSDDDDDEDESVAETLTEYGADEEEVTEGLKELRRYRLEEFQITKSSGKVVELRLGAGHETVVRDMKFGSPQDAKAFCDLIQRMRRLQEERTQRQVARYKSNSPTPTKSGDGATTTQSRSLLGGDEEAGDDINLLVEIVGANNLPVADISSTDPYVIVRMSGQEVHRTKVITNDLDPIWTLEKGSLFVLTMTPEKFFSCTGGMTFTIKDYDSMGSNEILGTVNVPLDELLKGEGERTEYLVAVDRKMEGATKKIAAIDSKLFLRFKKAASSDIDFMEAFKNNEKKLGVYLSETYLPIREPHSKMLRGQKKKGKDGGDTLFRVKPFPDPTREDETKWMTEKQIEAASLQNSTHWVESGSGDLGKVYVEIIGCDDLPNMDSATMNVRDKTDAFACCMFEDCIVNTDVVTDSLSPRWPPWSRRAFAFNISHPASHVIVGLFDYDPELGAGQLLSRATSDLHDPIGRTSINLSKLLPGTTYDLTYKLYYGELAEHREKDRGTVHVRVRVVWNDVRKAMIAGMLPPSDNYVSVSNKVDFAVTHYTADGIVDERKFSMDLFTKYIEELESYLTILDYFSEAALVVWLWRGHYKVKVGSKTLLLPLHSLVMYVWLILVTWNFNLFPSFMCFALGWAMLATNEQMKKDPSCWRSPRGYFRLLRLLLVGSLNPETIETNKNASAIVAFDNKIKADEEKKKARLEQEAKHQAELEALQAEVETEEVDIASSAKPNLLEKVSVNPMAVLKPVLYPIQQQLQQVVSLVRILKSIVIWEETYYAFWLVTLSFVASALLLFVPWAFLLRWILRIVVWIGLGPWMMLVDKYYFQKKVEAAEDGDEAIKAALKERYSEILQSASLSRVRKERALKLKSMKRFCFGKYLVSVPAFREDLYWDSPLPSSYANPAPDTDGKSVTIVEKKFGQKLEGDMVPQREIQAVEMRKAAAGKKERKRIWKRKLLRGRRARGDAKKSEEAPLLAPEEADEHKDYQAFEPQEEGTRSGEEASTGKSRLKILPGWFS